MEEEVLSRVQVLSREEFAALKGDYPHRHQVINSLGYIPYCNAHVR